MPFSHEQLETLGYVRQPDGTYSRRPANLDRRIPHPIPQQPPRQTLDGPPHRKEESKKRITVCLTRKAPKLLDADNYAGGCKPIIDQMRYAGLIADDDPETVEITFRQERVKRSQQGMLIEISATPPLKPQQNASQTPPGSKKGHHNG